MGGRGFQSRGIMVVVALVVISATASLGGKWVEAQVHHVVGGDRGWDPNSDLVSWSTGRVFRVGDQIWFTYSLAQGLIAELKSREEYESCDVRNPIKMYTEGLHTVPLEREGIRYFVSSDLQNCNSGLKLHVEVLPKAAPITHSFTTATTKTRTTFEAAAPTTPSASPPYAHNTILMLIAVMLCFTMLLVY